MHSQFGRAAGFRSVYRKHWVGQRPGVVDVDSHTFGQAQVVGSHGHRFANPTVEAGYRRAKTRASVVLGGLGPERSGDLGAGDHSLPDGKEREQPLGSARDAQESVAPHGKHKPAEQRELIRCAGFADNADRPQPTTSRAVVPLQ